MRLPFLKIQQDAFPRAKLLAGLLRVSRREAMGMVLDLWAWGLDLTPDGQDETLVGVFIDKDPSGMLAAALEWKDGPDCLTDAMTRAGFVELLDGGFRIRGLDEYAGALELPAKRSEAGKLGAAKRWQTDGKPMAKPKQPDGKRDGKPITNDGQTQTQTQTQKEEALKPLRAAEAAPRAGKVKVTEPEKPASPRHAPLIPVLCQIFLEMRGAKYDFTGRDAKALSEMLGKGADWEILARWRAGLEGQYRERVDTLWDLRDKWNALGHHAQVPVEPAPSKLNRPLPAPLAVEVPF